MLRSLRLYDMGNESKRNPLKRKFDKSELYNFARGQIAHYENTFLCPALSRLTNDFHYLWLPIINVDIYLRFTPIRTQQLTEIKVIKALLRLLQLTSTFALIDTSSREALLGTKSQINLP